MQSPSITEALLGVPTHTRLALDVSAGGITVAAVVGWLPSIAAVLSIIWTSLSIYIAVRKLIDSKKAKSP